MRSRVAPLVLLAFALMGVGATHAETRLVVPFPPGGGSGFVARHLADALPASLGEPVAVLHRPGADGWLATEEVAHAPPDGRTLLLGSTSSMIFAPVANKRPAFDPTQDFALVGMIATVPRILVVDPALPVKTLGDLIRLARASPGTLACGMADRLSEHAVRLFERLAGVQLGCVAYDGVAALREALQSGRRRLAFESAYLPDVQRGDLRALAVAAPTRMKALPDVPTASEAGLPGLDVRTWLALFAPKGTEPARVDKLSVALAAALQDANVVHALEIRGYVPRPMSPLQARNYIERDVQVWRRGMLH